MRKSLIGALLLAGCVTNPQTASIEDLCIAFIGGGGDPQAMKAELDRRGVDPNVCPALYANWQASIYNAYRVGAGVTCTQIGNLTQCR